MSWMFGKRNAPAPPPPPPPAAEPSLGDQIKLNRRKLDKACRELDRERLKLETQERKLTAEIRKVAAANQIEAAKSLAKDLARTRTHISKMYHMRTQMQSVSMQMASMHTQEAMTGTMANTVQMMTRMNKGMNLPAMQHVLMQFEMEQGKMEMTSEMIDDSMGGMVGAEESAEADHILQEVLAQQTDSVMEKIGAPVPSYMMGPDRAGNNVYPMQNPNVDEMMFNLGNRR